MNLAAVTSAHGITAAQATIIAAIFAVISTVVGSTLNAALGRSAEAAQSRRDHYADAVGVLYAWAEYPYRIRRRTSNGAEELARLANIGHDLQQQLRIQHTWIVTENRSVAAAYIHVWRSISKDAGPCAKDAWTKPEITNPADMNLAPWGPPDHSEDLNHLQEIIATRFGHRRLAPWLPQRKLNKLMPNRSKDPRPPTTPVTT